MKEKNAKFESSDATLDDLKAFIESTVTTVKKPEKCPVCDIGEKYNPLLLTENEEGEF